jgi:hypothetical protein
VNTKTTGIDIASMIAGSLTSNPVILKRLVWISPPKSANAQRKIRAVLVCADGSTITYERGMP